MVLRTRIEATILNAGPDLVIRMLEVLSRPHAAAASASSDYQI